MPSWNRPHAAISVSDRVHAWIDWVGLTRLMTSAVAVVIVCFGAFWLVRSSAPPSEAALPLATPASSGPAVTLAPPTTVMGASAADANAVDAAAGAVLVVHVAGAVARPGLYEFTGGSRVADAISAAGGTGSDADVDILNLAAPLADGMRLYVPRAGENVPAELVVEVPRVSISEADTDTTARPIDLNQASAIELETLPGVGPATATAIITERETNGPFASVDDLERVPGIGPAKLAALSDLVTT
jgi:competence protein ComEA